MLPDSFYWCVNLFTCPLRRFKSGPAKRRTYDTRIVIRRFRLGAAGPVVDREPPSPSIRRGGKTNEIGTYTFLPVTINDVINYGVIVPRRSVDRRIPSRCDTVTNGFFTLYNESRDRAVYDLRRRVWKLFVGTLRDSPVSVNTIQVHRRILVQSHPSCPRNADGI